MADTFTCQWLNRLDQYGHTDITLIITHDQGVIPSARIGKNYHLLPELIDAIFLESEALKEVEMVITAWNEENQ